MSGTGVLFVFAVVVAFYAGRIWEVFAADFRAAKRQRIAAEIEAERREAV